MNISHGKIFSFLQFFTGYFQDYWHILYPVMDWNDPSKPYAYFYNIERKALDYSGPFTDDGIYLFYGYDQKYHIHALELAQYGLACWLAWSNARGEQWLERALRHSDWLVKNQENDGGWRIDHKNPRHADLPTPWPSAMCQGLAVSTLVRAYEYSADIEYLMAARKAADFLHLDVAAGGTLRKVDDIGFIYEEYPKPQLSGVLNGYITAVLSLFELSNRVSEYRPVYDDNINNLKKILPLYDNGYWSYYSLDNIVASGFYHRYHIIQLSVLSDMDFHFRDYKELFEKYLRKNGLKALYSKMKNRLKI